MVGTVRSNTYEYSRMGGTCPGGARQKRQGYVISWDQGLGFLGAGGRAGLECADYRFVFLVYAHTDGVFSSSSSSSSSSSFSSFFFGGCSWKSLCFDIVFGALS